MVSFSLEVVSGADFLWYSLEQAGPGPLDNITSIATGGVGSGGPLKCVYNGNGSGSISCNNVSGAGPLYASVTSVS